MAIALRALLALVFAGWPMAAAAQDVAEALDDWRIERVESRWPLGESGVVSLVNSWGDVRVRAHGSEIYLLTLTQHHERDAREMVPVVVSDEHGTRIRIDFSGVLEGVEPAEFARRRVDATLFVPADTELSLETDRGLAELSGLRGPVTVTSGRGEIRAKVAGPAVLRSEHGKITAVFTDTNWAAPSSVETLTGPIEAWLPRGAASEVEITTRGVISTDYSMHIEHDPGSSLRRGRANVGEDGPRLELTSHQGAIGIRESKMLSGSAEETK